LLLDKNVHLAWGHGHRINAERRQFGPHTWHCQPRHCAACRRLCAVFLPEGTCRSRRNIRHQQNPPQRLWVAVIPSALRADRHALRIFRLIHRGKPLREPLAIFWDKRRPLPRYATAFCEMLADYMRKVFPITRPSESKAKVSAFRRGRSGRRPAP
jgi:hypothetical protein